MPAAYAAYAALAAVVNDTTQHFVRRIEPGDILTFNNRRILHSRQKFNPSDGRRLLRGTYVDLDALLSRYRVLQRRHAPSDANRHGLFVPRTGYNPHPVRA